jgi:penicillin amidase
MIARWDFVESADSGPAALMEVWVSRHLGNAFKKAVLSPAAADAVPSPDIEVMLAMLEQPKDDAGKRDALLLTSLAVAYAEMQKLQGTDASKWQWGRLHHSQPPHPLAGAVDAATAARLNVASLPDGGSAYTPNQAAYATSDFLRTNGPSFRVIVDVGNWDNSRAVNMPGQSGDPNSPHYQDLAPLWLNGQYFPLLYTRSRIDKATESRIDLVPARSTR